MKYIKNILLGIFLLFLLSLFFLYANHQVVMESTYGDMDLDGKDELIILTKKVLARYGKDLVIYKDNDEIYRSDISDLKPWKLIVGDIDGDKVPELSIGVYTRTYYHPVMAKRPFIYNYHKGSIQPKWRGSRLSRPLLDYIFFDLDQDGSDEIISIERLEDGGNIISSYKWRGFGIEAYLQGAIYKDIESIWKEEDRIYMKTKDGDEVELEDYWR